MKTRLVVLAGAAALGLAGVAQAQTIFTDDFDTDTSANWTVLQETALGPPGPPDSSAAFSVDYSLIEGVAIPSAPNSSGGTTRGLYMTANRNPNELLSIEAIIAMPNIAPVPGDTSIEFDMFISFLGTVGTTHFGLAGIDHDGTTKFLQNISGTGYTYAVDGDGGTSTDYRAYIGKDIKNGAAGGFVAPGNSQNNTNAFYTAMFPSPPWPTAGIPGRGWVRVKLARIGNDVEYSLNGNLIARITDTTYMAGLPHVGFQDSFTSPTPAGGFVIIDNVRVTGVPEPATLAVLGLGAAALIRRRRK